MFVEFHIFDNLRCFNVERIVSFYPNENKTLIDLDKFSGYDKITVDEDYETVKNLIEDAQLRYLYPDIEVED